jgi:hypothetical protein
MGDFKVGIKSTRKRPATWENKDRDSFKNSAGLHPTTNQGYENKPFSQSGTPYHYRNVKLVITFEPLNLTFGIKSTQAGRLRFFGENWRFSPLIEQDMPHAY